MDTPCQCGKILNVAYGGLCEDCWADVQHRLHGSGVGSPSLHKIPLVGTQRDRTGLLPVMPVLSPAQKGKVK